MQFGYGFGDEITKQTGPFIWAAKEKIQKAKDWQEGISGVVPLNSEAAPGGEKFPFSIWRVYSLGFLILAVILVFIARLFFLQIVEGKKNLFLSEGNRVFVQLLPAERGVIYSQDGKILAGNRPGFKATLTLSQVPFEEEQRIIKELADLLGVSLEEITEKFNQAKKSPFTAVTLKNDLTYQTQLKLAVNLDKFPGIKVAESWVRDYPEGREFSHVLGYLGSIDSETLKKPEFYQYHPGERIGKEGVEKSYESLLRGTPGEKLIEVDVWGEVKKVIREKLPEVGYNLVLSIDYKMQKRAYQILEEGVKEYQATGGVIIVQEPETGRIRVAVNYPTFDNQDFTGGISPAGYEKLLADPYQPMFNRAISGLYPPGSAIKPAVAVGALTEGIITPETRINDFPQVIRIGRWEYPDWTVSWGRGAHGVLTVRGAISHSCDVFFYKIGGGYSGGCDGHEVGCRTQGLGAVKIGEYFKKFGLGKSTGIDISGEAAGLVPNPEWKSQVKEEAWYLGNTYHLSIGQGDLLVTPLQLVNYISAVANGGKLMRPKLGLRIENSKGQIVEQLKPQAVSSAALTKEDEEILSVVREGMRMSVTEGIIYPLRGTLAAAKTGTAEFGTLNAQGEYQTHAWVTGFWPYDAPKLSFVVLLESGGKSNNAAQVARELLEAIIE